MELDDLKSSWNQAAGQPSNINIMETINGKPQNPLALLQRKLKFSFYIFPFVVILFAGHLFSKTSPVHMGTAMLYSILLIEFIFQVYSYYLIKTLQQSQGRTKDNLLQRVNGLGQIMRLQLITNEALYALMAIILEISMHYHWDNRFDGWYTINPALRITGYITVLAFIYLAKRSSNQKHYGQYIVKLSALLKQIE